MVSMPPDPVSCPLATPRAARIGRMDVTRPEVWLRGPVPGAPAELMPVVQSLLQVGEDIEGVAALLSDAELWATPGGAASVGFHLKHIAGSLDRLLTYARGEALTTEQRVAFAAEPQAEDPPLDVQALVGSTREAIARAIEQVRATPVSSLQASRGVGRAGLPSTVQGLLFHAAEHAQRHAAQIITTTKVVAGRRRNPTA